MRIKILNTICCPQCLGTLTATAFVSDTTCGFERIKDGLLSCSTCNAVYIISGYIPRMLPHSLMNNPSFIETYRDKLPKQLLEKHPETHDNLSSLKKATIRNFGAEWKMWNSFGWNGDVSMDQTKAIFDYKVMMTPQELSGKLVLDAGCGNGRYTKIARDYGGEVFGVDLSGAVESAFENTKYDEKIHIIQSDLFKLPFRKETFDFVFSNGVLMHTGNARKAFLNLSTLLKNDGTITIHLYHKGNIIYECNDLWLRFITTRLPLSWVYTFSKAVAGIAKLLPKWFVEYGLNMFMRIESHPHYVFDWYTAPIATHHTYPEVYGWLKEADLHLIADHNTSKRPWRKWILPFFFLTVKAQKKPYAGPVRHTTA